MIYDITSDESAQAGKEYPMAERGSAMCKRLIEGFYVCTREEKHEGPHVAHGLGQRACAKEEQS